MTKILSMGTLLFITLAVALTALGTSMFNAVLLRDIKPQVTVIEKTVATQSANVAPVVVTASPSATPAKKSVVVTKPPVSVSPTVAK